MDKWEYLTGRTVIGGVKFEYGYGGKKEYEWNELGQKGWELTGMSDGHVIFKRRIPDAPTQTQAQHTSRAPEVDMGLTF